MKIAFYMPFKPLGHPNPSGDLVTGAELHDFLRDQGHATALTSRLRCRWLFLKPWLWPALFLERLRLVRRLKKNKPDIWLSYHSYYKAPDLLGPWCARRLGIPYVLFQGVYSTKRRRVLKTLPGFLLNRRALLAAGLVFTNKRRDEHNLKRLLPADRVVHVPPGIRPDEFCFDPVARQDLRSGWKTGATPVILTAAMFRNDIKTEGILEVLETCASLRGRGLDFFLVIVGDGAARERVRRAVRQKMEPDRVILTGRVDRAGMYRFYSAADLFVFPGINESLGMVYLEAQSCGLPVVAYRNWGAAEAVADGKTGLLVEAAAPGGLGPAVERLLADPDFRKRMGKAAAGHIRQHHDLSRNYRRVERLLAGQVERK